MRVVDRLARREGSWRELEGLLDRLQDPRRVVSAGGGHARKGSAASADVLRLGELYRAACTDLMLAESHDLPRDTVAYLHALVARAHSALYRAQGFRLADWARALFETVPRQLRADPALRLAALIFFMTFFFCGLLAAGRPGFAEKVLPGAFLEQMDAMYAEPLDVERKDGLKRSDTLMAGFYIQHNTTIGLQCFAYGLLFGLGSLYQLVSNAMILGTVFGHMATAPHWKNFYTFVTAHSVFELTAIVFAGAAGLRLGYGLIDTKGQTRLASLRREARRALPTVGASVVLFILAAFVEGFVSASSLPYYAKAGIALCSAALLTAYLTLCGRGRLTLSP